MRTTVLSLVLLMVSLPLVAEEPWLEKTYFGCLYVGTATKEYYRFQNDIFPLAAVKTKFPVMAGVLRTRLMYFQESVAAHLWWEKDVFSPMNFKVGYMPRPISIINRPEPVSSKKNFEPMCRQVIPGPAFGALLVIKVIKSRRADELMLGLCQTGRDSLELGFGLQRKNWLVFRQIGITGYCADYENQQRRHIVGAAFNAEMENLSLMFFKGIDFKGIDADSVVATYSGFIGIDLAGDVSFYSSLVYQQDRWRTAEFGGFKTLSEQHGIVKVKYLIGAGYVYSEVVPKSVNFYLQVWFDK